MSFIPEWLLKNAVIAGMTPTMVVLMSRDMASMHATSLRFWGVMQLATITGFNVAYPVNLWLVGVKLKHGMGTVRALGEGGQPVTAESSIMPMPEMARGAMQGIKGIAADMGATPPQIVAMMVLTLVALGAGIIIATVFGRWVM